MPPVPPSPTFPTRPHLLRNSTTLPSIFFPRPSNEDHFQTELESVPETDRENHENNEQIYNFTNIINKHPNICASGQHANPKEETKEEPYLENYSENKEKKDPKNLEEAYPEIEISYSSDKIEEEKLKDRESTPIRKYQGELNIYIPTPNNMESINSRTQGPAESIQLEIPNILSRKNSNSNKILRRMPSRRKFRAEDRKNTVKLSCSNYSSVLKRSLTNKSNKSKQSGDDWHNNLNVPITDPMLAIQSSIKSLININKQILDKLKIIENKTKSKDKGLLKGSTLLQW